MADEISTLFPDQDVIANGETFTISPLKFGQIPKAMGFAKNILGQMAANNGASTQTMIATIMASAGEDFLNLLCFAIPNLTREKLNLMASDDGMKIALAFMEQNVSFFVQKVAPLLKEAKTKFETITASAAASSV